MPPAVDEPMRGARDASTVLADAARALHGERDRDRLIGWATTATSALTGASASGVCITTHGEATWAVDGAPDLAALADPRSHPCLRSAWQGDGTAVCDDVGGNLDTASIAAVLDVGMLVAVPVVQQDGMPHGILVVAHRTPGGLDDRAVAAVEIMAAHLGVALDNQARLRALDEARNVQREVVEQLQEAVRPPIPSVPDTELGVSYRPAETGAPTGGDLYDWVLLPDGRLHLVVVDVMGKGVGATKDALAVTHALRLLVLDGCPIEDVVARADAVVTAQNPELVATLVVAHYCPSTGELTLAGAGHPPPLLVSGGVARELSAPGVPIGWPGAGSTEILRVTLTRNDTVVFYTDGLIEAGKDILVGLENIARYGEETSAYPAAQQARVLVERALTGAARRDDSLAVVLRCRHAPPATGIALGPFEHHLSPSPATVPVARNLLREWLTRVPLEDECVHDLVLVATELCANAVEHARWDDGGVVLRARSEGPDVVIEVEDDGGGLSWPHLDEEPPDAESEQGRGLWLVHALTDELVPEFRGAHTVVMARSRNVSPVGAPPYRPAPPGDGPSPAPPRH